MEFIIDNKSFIYNADYRIEISKNIYNSISHEDCGDYYIYELSVNKINSILKLIKKRYSEMALPENKPYREGWQLLSTDEPKCYGCFADNATWETNYGVLSNIFRMHRIFEFAKTITIFNP